MSKLNQLSCCLLIFLSGCAADQRRDTSASSTVEYKLPTLTPVDPTKESQERDGIRVTAVAYPFSAQRKVSYQYRRLPAIIVVNGQLPAEMQEISSFEVQPTNVTFKVRINNQLERVLRLTGTVVTFQVGGQQEVLDPVGYRDFVNGIILPRHEMEFKIKGPSIERLPDTKTFGFYLYDIVTETDAAGNATKRSNFEWFYTLSIQAKTEELPVPQKKKVHLSVAAVESIRQRESAPYKWVDMPSALH